jgi:hypothetical protein
MFFEEEELNREPRNGIGMEDFRVEGRRSGFIARYEGGNVLVVAFVKM